MMLPAVAFTSFLILRRCAEVCLVARRPLGSLFALQIELLDWIETDRTNNATRWDNGGISHSLSLSLSLSLSGRLRLKIIPSERTATVTCVLVIW
uniref:Putative secreted protein n=1 Tax=Anopheles darlingi TaxID=43151 RepID=A0A2M4DJI8_ANODA